MEAVDRGRTEPQNHSGSSVQLFCQITLSLVLPPFVSFTGLDQGIFSRVFFFLSRKKHANKERGRGIEIRLYRSKLTLTVILFLRPVGFGKVRPKTNPPHRVIVLVEGRWMDGWMDQRLISSTPAPRNRDAQLALVAALRLTSGAGAGDLAELPFPAPVSRTCTPRCPTQSAQ